jgi:hypothetical protein
MAYQFFIWDGIGQRIIGKIAKREYIGDSSKVWVERIDGCECGPILRSRLRPCPPEFLNWAVWLGTCYVPPTGNPPHNCY